MSASSLAERWRDALYAQVVTGLLPFWQRAVDRERGGVFTCWNNAGTRLMRRDKYTWSQGRFVWLWSRVADAVRRGYLPGDAGDYLREARRAAEFLFEHARLPSGECAFLLSESGRAKEPQPGAGLAISIYADCFVALGFAELARVSGDRLWLARAWDLAESIERRLDAGNFPTAPEPVPPGYRAHGPAMIRLNVALALAEACAALGDAAAPAAERKCAAAAEAVLRHFFAPGELPREMVRTDGAEPDELLTRHFNPGHALESLWLVILAARRAGRQDWIARARQGIVVALEAGWDAEAGGLLHYADRRGGEPQGRAGGSPYEQLVLRTWHRKLWWVHSEAIYAAALADQLAPDPALEPLAQRAFDYALRIFPQPDPAVGEWIQIRTRAGAPVDDVVALPVKDPYHILRNFIMALELSPPPSVLPVPARHIPPPALGRCLIGAEEEELVLAALRSQSLFRYYGADRDRPPAMVATLEEEFRAMVGTRHALAVTSGSAALEVAFGALEIGPGDEVIIPAWSWVSCFTAVVRVGARPVLAEIDDTLCLAPGEIRRLAGPRTKAVLVVHFQGVAADMDPILREAEAAGIAVVEDCAESPGASYRGRRVGSMGRIGIFSFQQQKTITSGEGGMVVTSDPRLHERAVRMHDLGQFREFHGRQRPPAEPAFAGGQFRMSELTAAVALAQFRRLDRIRGHCRELQRVLHARLAGLPAIALRRIPDPAGDSGFETYFWLADTPARDALRARLADAGIPCEQMTGTYAQYRRPYVVSGRAHAPGASPFPAGAAWPAAGYRPEDFPATEGLIHRFIALPLGVNYAPADAAYIGDVVAALVSS